MNAEVATAAGTAEAMVEVRGVRKVYRRDAEEITVLDGMDLRVPAGEFVALMGPSGSGKTTLLNLIAGIDRPTAGEVVVAGTDVARLSESELAKWRSHHVGFIFQFYNLIPVLTAVENVELPLLLTVLVVDDDADARNLISTVLEERGARVLAVAGAQEALTELDRSRPDVLLSDIEMPGGDGYALIRKIRARPAEQGGRLPAAALTAYARTEDRMQALLAGFHLHLPKPVQPAELAAVVASLVGRTG